MKRVPLTAEALWAIPRVGGPAPAPDGKAFLVPVTTYSMETNESTTRLWLCDADGKGAGRALTTSEASSGHPSWSPDGRRIAFVRKPGGPKPDEKKKTGPRHPDQPQLYVMGLDGGEAERLTDLPLGVADPLWFPDGKRIAFVAGALAGETTVAGMTQRVKEREEEPVKAVVTEDRFYRYWDRYVADGKVHHLWVYDLETREATDLTPDSKRWFDLMDPSGQYRISPDGREIAFSACCTSPPHDPLCWGIFTVDVPARGGKAGRTHEVTKGCFPETVHPEYSPDGKWIVYGAQREIDFYADRVRMVAYDRKRRTHKVLTEDWDRSASGWTFTADSRTLILRAEVGGRSALFALDFGKALRDPKKNPPRELVRGGSFGSPEIAGGRIFTSLSSLLSPPECVSIRLDGRDQRKITRFTEDALRNVRLSRVREVHFRGAEGHRVQMYVLFPPQKSLKAPWPLVHMIHGGPHGAFGDEWHWRWNPHVFAAPGYLVALVNFHGSTGWGQEFAASILGRWGDQPYIDIMSATAHLIERGWADPGRMAATGGSYGGYLASWIAAQTDRFACIVNHAGVCDFQTQYASDVTQGRRRSMGGEPWDNVAGMDRWNPMRHARGFKSPMLVIHGEKDYRVPYVQGLAIYNIYKAMKLPARLVVYPDENHWILKPRNSRHWYGEVHTWLDRWIGKSSAKSKAVARAARAARD